MTDTAGAGASEVRWGIGGFLQSNEAWTTPFTERVTLLSAAAWGLGTNEQLESDTPDPSGTCVLSALAAWLAVRGLLETHASV